MRARWQVWLGFTGLVAFAVVGGRFLARPGVSVQTARVERRPLARIVSAAGEIQARGRVLVGPETAGRLTEIRVSEGERVVRGQVLAKLETDRPRNDVQTRRAGLRRLEAELGAAEKAIEAHDGARLALEAALHRAEAERERAARLDEQAVELSRDGLIARNERERRRAALHRSEAAVEGARADLSRLDAERERLIARRDAADERIAQAAAQLDRFEDALSRLSVVAPIDGVVSDLPAKVGEAIGPGVGGASADRILTLADLSTLAAEALVDEADIVYVALGQAAEVVVEGPPQRPLAGRVSAIGGREMPRSGGRARDFKVTITVENPPKTLRPGMRCIVRIAAGRGDDPPAFPLRAVTVRPDAGGEEREGVFVVREGRAEFVAVETGVAGGGWVEALGGVAVGDEVVTGSRSALRLLESGAPVRVEVADSGGSE